MNLHQLRFAREVVRQGLNLTQAAKALHTSQPGISKSILELEQELGVDIFVRYGKRIKGLTDAGQEVLNSIEIILREVSNLKLIAEQYVAQDSGNLSIATTHTQARYVLPQPLAKLRADYPKVNISLHQGTPDQVARMLIEETAQVGMATESLADYDELVTLPCYEWHHVLVMPHDHPLCHVENVTLSDLAAEPLITYHPSFTGRTKIDAAFAKAQIQPRIALEAIDSDVINTYVELGLGVGIVAEMALNLPVGHARRERLHVKNAEHLFGKNVTRIAFKRGAYLRDFVYHFAQTIAPKLTKSMISAALKNHADSHVP